MKTQEFQKLDDNHKATELVIQAYHGENIQDLLNCMDSKQWSNVQPLMKKIDDGMHHHVAGNGGYFPALKFGEDGSIIASGHAVKETDSSTKIGQWFESIVNELPSEEINKTVGKWTP